MQDWLVMTIETEHEAAEVLTDFLSAYGAEGVAVKDPLDIKSQLQLHALEEYADDNLLKPNDATVIISAYFLCQQEVIRVNQTLQLWHEELYDQVPKKQINKAQLLLEVKEKIKAVSQFLDVGSGQINFSKVQEEDWANQWKQYYKTLKIGKGIVINPSWIPYEAKAEETVISLDPGSAFGTGEHETTYLCAELLEEVLTTKMQPQAVKMIDVGTGSGILAIIAQKLGVQAIDAIDIDANAVRVASENVEINGASQIKVWEGELMQVQDQSYDLIVANIIAKVLKNLAPVFAKKIKNAAYLITSGIIAEHKEMVVEAMEKAGFRALKEKEAKDWVAILWQKEL